MPSPSPKPKRNSLTPVEAEKIRRLAAQGLSQSTLATRFGVARSTIRAALAKDPPPCQQ